MFSVGLLGRLLSLLCVARRSRQTHENLVHNSKCKVILWFAGFIVFSGILNLDNIKHLSDLYL